MHEIKSEMKKNRWVQLSSPVQKRVGAELMLERLVLNMQPTPSAIFSRMLESDSEGFYCSMCSCCCVGV